MDFLYFDAGGGHRSAAVALQSIIHSHGYPWKVRLINLQEVLDPLDIFRKVTGVRLQDVYNLALAKGWTLGSSHILPVMHGLIRLYHREQVELLTKFWRRQKPDMVVSLIPNFNRAIWESLQAAIPGTPYVTILTDFADYPPHFWIEKDQPQYFICGTGRAAEQARALGHSTDRIFRTTGMILRPQFYDPVEIDCGKELQALGLKPHLPTGLVLFGGQGSGVMVPLAERLGAMPRDLQLIMVCGHNKRLRTRLERIETKNRIFVEGFTDRIPFYMKLCDFFIGKPGPGSISEALQLNLPVIVERNSWTLPQERYNADWVSDHGVGLVLENFREIVTAVEQLLSTPLLDEMKLATGQMQNQAVYEIPKILERILAVHPGASEQHAILRQ